MAGYSREFLIDAFVQRYESLGLNKVEQLHKLATKFYDDAGRDKFRVYASLDAEAVRNFKLATGRKS